MSKSVHDAAAKLVDLPFLTTRRACVVADCSRSTLQRSGPEPVGRRGRTYVYKTEDILRWLTSGIETRAASASLPAARTRASAPSANALDRIASLRKVAP